MYGSQQVLFNQSITARRSACSASRTKNQCSASNEHKPTTRPDNLAARRTKLYEASAEDIAKSWPSRNQTSCHNPHRQSCRPARPSADTDDEKQFTAEDVISSGSMFVKIRRSVSMILSKIHYPAPVYLCGSVPASLCAVK